MDISVFDPVLDLVRWCIAQFTAWRDGLDLNETSIRWCVSWIVAFLFTVWNGWDALLDLGAVYHSGRNGRIRASAIWFLRQDAVKAIACLFMVAAGVRAIFRIQGGVSAADLLTLAALLIAVNQVWNRMDRWRVKAAIKRAGGRPQKEKKDA